MADIIEVNINTLNSDIGNMQSELNGLRSEMKKAFTAVAELDRMWNGPANDAFKMTTSPWRRCVRSLTV